MKNAPQPYELVVFGGRLVGFGWALSGLLFKLEGTAKALVAGNCQSFMLRLLRPPPAPVRSPQLYANDHAFKTQE
jgi:hypothetical protein